MNWILPGPALLFCPADRPERFEKAAAVADGVILDLEDGVGARDKRSARDAVVHSRLDPSRTIVRINPVTTTDHSLDLEAVQASPYTTVMLAKTESVEQVDSLTPWNVIALCETPKGVLAAREIASCRGTAGMMWGAEDLIAAMGGQSSRHANGTYRDVARQARAQVLLAAGAHLVPAIDAVHLDIADIVGLMSEATDATASGFTATACIHPSQVAVVRRGYEPNDDEVIWARHVLEAARDEHGVFTFEGRMVDAPVLRHAERILRRAGSPE